MCKRAGQKVISKRQGGRQEGGGWTFLLLPSSCSFCFASQAPGLKKSLSRKKTARGGGRGEEGRKVLFLFCYTTDQWQFVSKETGLPALSSLMLQIFWVIPTVGLHPAEAHLCRTPCINQSWPWGEKAAFSTISIPLVKQAAVDSLTRVARSPRDDCYLFLMLASSSPEEAFILVSVSVWSTNRNIICVTLGGGAKRRRGEKKSVTQPFVKSYWTATAKGK